MEVIFYDPSGITITTTTEINIYEADFGIGTIVKTLNGVHKLTFDAVVTFGEGAADPDLKRQVGDQWLAVNDVDGEPLDRTQYVPLIHNGKRVTEWKVPTQLPKTRTARIHKVVKGENLDKIARTYKTSVDKLLAANKRKYPKITKANIRDGWELIIY